MSPRTPKWLLPTINPPPKSQPKLLLAVEARGETHQTKAGVVDQELRLKAPRAQLLLDPRCGAGLAEIDDDYMRPRVAALLDRLGQRFELRRAPRGEHKRMAVIGKHVGERRADTGGGAGDQCDGFRIRHDVRDRKTLRSPLAGSVST